jgi:hypothetical protein
MDEEIFGEGRKHLSKSKILPGIITPLRFLLFCFKLEKNFDNKFRDLRQK